MEQSDQPQQSSLNLKHQEASIPHVSQFDTNGIAAMRDFIEFLAELKEAQEEEWRKVGYDPQAPIQGQMIERGRYDDTLKTYSKHHNYTYYRDYPEGQYAIDPQSFERLPDSHIWVEENCLDTILRLLTKMMEGVVKGRSTFREEMNVLSEQDSKRLFLNLSIYAGFYNFVPAYYDRNGYYGQPPPLEQISFCERVFSQLWVLPSLTEEEWGMLREIASYRAKERLRYWYYMSKYTDWRNLVLAEEKVARSLRYSSREAYSYPQKFQLNEIDALVRNIVAGEEKRLRECIGKLCVPLIMLAQQKTTRKRKVVERVTSPEGFLQSLQELLQIEQPVPTSTEKPSVVEGTLLASPTAMVTVKKVEHQGQSYIYHIELTDPGILPEPCEFTLTYQEGSSGDEVVLREVEIDE